MDINIDDEYKIGSDSLQFTLRKKGFIKDKISYTTVGYFPSLSGVLKSYKKEKLLRSECTDFDEVLTKVLELDNKIEEISKQLGI